MWRFIRSAVDFALWFQHSRPRHTRHRQSSPCKAETPLIVDPLGPRLPPSRVPTNMQILRKAAKQAEEAKRVATASSSSVTANYGPGAGAAAAKAAAAATSMAAADTPRVGGGAGSVRKKRRWDDGGVTPGGGAMGDGDETPAAGNSGKAVSDWDADVATPVRRGGFGGGETPGRTPGGRGGGETPGRSRWDQTPSRDAQVCVLRCSRRACVCSCVSDYVVVSCLVPVCSGVSEPPESMTCLT